MLEPFLTELSTEKLDEYAAIIDGIPAKHGDSIISSENVIQSLRGRPGLAHTQPRHLLKMLIIQRLKLLPTPQTMITVQTGAGGITISVNSMVAAVSNVLELLESVLTHVDMADLIASRRVNEAFYRLIETSPTLQDKLFLPPSILPPGYSSRNHVNSPSLAAPSGSPGIVASMNPLLTTASWEYSPSPDGKGLLVLQECL